MIDEKITLRNITRALNRLVKYGDVERKKIKNRYRNSYKYRIKK